MVKREESNAKGDEGVDDYEAIVANIEKINNSVLSIGKHFFNLTKDQFDNVQNKSIDYVTRMKEDGDDLYRRKFEEIEKTIQLAIEDAERTAENGKKEVDQYFPRPYQSRDPYTLEMEKKLLVFDQGESSDFFFGHRPGFRHFFSRKIEQTPFGYTTKSPSRKVYRDCTDKDGLKVWDSEGYWRCLFPNAQVEPEFLRIKNEKFSDKILTKEDFLEAVKNVSAASNATETSGVYNLGSKGTFFNQFSDYLDWKKLNWRESTKSHCSRRRWGSRWEDTSDGIPSKVLAAETEQQTVPFQPSPRSASDHSMDSSPSVVSFSLVSSYETNVDSKEIVLTESRKECYNDGTSSTKNVYKTKPIGAKEWATIEEYSSGKNQEPKAIMENFDSTSPNDRKGWFWN